MVVSGDRLIINDTEPGSHLCWKRVILWNRAWGGQGAVDHGIVIAVLLGSGGAAHLPGAGCRKSFTVSMNRSGWSTKVMWPLCWKMTSFEPGIRSCMARAMLGSDSSWSPAVIRVGTWIAGRRSAYSTDGGLAAVMYSPCEPHISRDRSQDGVPGAVGVAVG